MASAEDWGWGDEEHTALVPARAEAQVITKSATEARPKARRNKRVVQPWQICSKKDIEPYKKFKVLFGERKFAQEYAKQKQTLSFTDDLPTEIRLRVYDFLFHTPGDFFEFWAPEENTTGENKWQNLFRTYVSKKKGLRIMRVSKKIHEEVAEYFYGRFNMRFSNYDGFLVMAMFNHSIRPLNCSLIKHITVRVPNSNLTTTLRGWNRFVKVQTSRGMRTPYIGLRDTRHSRGMTTAECNEDITVIKGFRQLRNMAGLKLLEILVPWNYLPQEMIVYDDNGQSTRTQCTCEVFQNLSPEDRLRHVFEAHPENSDYWRLVADLKHHTSSDDLTVAVVLDYNSTKRGGKPFEIYFDDDQLVRNVLRRARWVAAYASLMGYKFGYARYAEDGAYKVRYDEDTLMAESLELLKADPLEYDPSLEPPELSG